MLKSKNKKVLLCDDDEGILDVATIILESNGFTVVSLLHGEKIFEVIENEKPEVILLDLWMPKLNGSEITKKLKANKKTSSIPIIIVSANKDIEKVTQEIGANAFLAKPFDLDVLVDKVKEFLD